MSQNLSSAAVVIGAWRVKENNEPRHGISNNVVCVASKGSDQPVHMHSLITAFAGRMNILWLLSYWPNTI